ncbi:hypothetical protein, partial [Spongiactinospora sp. TRM90649]|uniref:hypothetical protein n=1 Tax=Spongiactinospora sp. TRM90649 TaxID=3031114 RepID=UPI0023F9C324
MQVLREVLEFNAAEVAGQLGTTPGRRVTRSPGVPVGRAGRRRRSHAAVKQRFAAKSSVRFTVKRRGGPPATW